MLAAVAHQALGGTALTFLGPPVALRLAGATERLVQQEHRAKPVAAQQPLGGTPLGPPVALSHARATERIARWEHRVIPAAAKQQVIGPLNTLQRVEIIPVRAMGPYAQLARLATVAAMDGAIGTPRPLTPVVKTRVGEAERGV